MKVIKVGRSREIENEKGRARGRYREYVSADGTDFIFKTKGNANGEEYGRSDQYQAFMNGLLALIKQTLIRRKGLAIPITAHIDFQLRISTMHTVGLCYASSRPHLN